MTVTVLLLIIGGVFVVGVLGALWRDVGRPPWMRLLNSPAVQTLGLGGAIAAAAAWIKRRGGDPLEDANYRLLGAQDRADKASAAKFLANNANPAANPYLQRHAARASGVPPAGPPQPPGP